jgi:hypothetical protein
MVGVGVKVALNAVLLVVGVGVVVLVFSMA